MSIKNNNKQTEVTVEETKVTGKTDANEYYTNLGYKILEESNKEEIGSESSTLHFIELLGLRSRPTVRKVGGKNVPASTTIGVTLVSDKAIEVPVIDPRKNKDTGIDIKKDVTYRKVQKGKPFHLNMYELMYLIIQPQYAGFLTYNGDPTAVSFAPKMAKYHAGEAKLPTPVLIFKSGLGSIKENMVDIDEKVNGVWVAKPEYAKEFGVLFDSEKANKAKVKSMPTQTAISIGLRNMLYKGNSKMTSTTK